MATSRPAVSQPKSKVWRIGALHFHSRKLLGRVASFRGFFEGLRDLDYVEGRNLVVYREFAENDSQRLPELAVQLLKQNVHLIVTAGTQAVRAAKQATSTLPIVALNLTVPVILALSPRITALALQHKLPSIWWAIGRRGDRLASYGPSYLSQGRRAATIATKILQGAKAADLPFQQPVEFDLVINMKIAKALGITIPPSILVRVTRMIE